MNHEELRKLAECESSNHRNDGACRLRDALDAITPLLDKLEAIERLHRPIIVNAPTRHTVCEECSAGWPCPTARLLMEEP